MTRWEMTHWIETPNGGFEWEPERERVDDRPRVYAELPLPEPSSESDPVSEPVERGVCVISLLSR